MEYLTQWLRSIVLYFLLVTVVMQILPNDSYRKYLRVFIGMVLMILILQPIAHFLGVEENLAFSFEKAVNALDMEERELQLAQREEAIYAGLTREYTEQMREKAKELAQAEGFELLSFEISSDGIFLTVSADRHAGSIVIEDIVVGNSSNEQSEQTMSAKERVKTDLMKSLFSDFYNLDSDNINITIQR